MGGGGAIVIHPETSASVQVNVCIVDSLLFRTTGEAGLLFLAAAEKEAGKVVVGRSSGLKKGQPASVLSCQTPSERNQAGAEKGGERKGRPVTRSREGEKPIMRVEKGG